MMIDDERTELRRDDAVAEEATRIVDRSLEATRLREPHPAGSARAARVPGASAEHAAYTVRRESLTAPVTRTAAPVSPAGAVVASALAEADPHRRRRTRRLVTILAVVGFVVLVAAAVVALVVLVTAS